MVKKVIQWIREYYEIQPDDLFHDPDIAVFRHRGTKKWFGVIMRIPLCKLGLANEEAGFILNLKEEPLFIDSILDHRRFFRAYHMNKEHWISVLLDGSVPMEELEYLIQNSYRLTAPKKGAKK